MQDIARAIAPYLSSLRENVRSKWRKLLSKAGAEIAISGDVFASPESMMSHPSAFAPNSMSGINDNMALYNQPYDSNYSQYSSHYQNNDSYNNGMQSYSRNDYASVNSSMNLSMISNSVNGFHSYRKSSSHKLNPNAAPVEF